MHVDKRPSLCLSLYQSEDTSFLLCMLPGWWNAWKRFKSVSMLWLKILAVFASVRVWYMSRGSWVLLMHIVLIFTRIRASSEPVCPLFSCCTPNIWQNVSKRTEEKPAFKLGLICACSYICWTMSVSHVFIAISCDFREIIMCVWAAGVCIRKWCSNPGVRQPAAVGVVVDSFKFLMWVRGGKFRGGVHRWKASVKDVAGEQGEKTHEGRRSEGRKERNK